MQNVPQQKKKYGKVLNYIYNSTLTCYVTEISICFFQLVSCTGKETRVKKLDALAGYFKI